MALVPIYNFTQNDGGETGLIVNATVYGSPNQNRNEAAEYILWSKTNKAGARTFYNPDQGNVLTNLQYSVNTNIADGWYEMIRLRIQFYNGTNYVEQQESGGVITQYASIFYYGTTGLVYKAVAPSTGQDPTNTNFFQVVEDLSTILDNPNIDVYYKNVYVDYHQNACIVKKFSDKGCNCSSTEQKFLETLYNRKTAADIAFSNNKPEQTEEISEKINETCVQC